jgi:transposase-like protein
MPKPRKQFSPALKAKVAVEAIKGEKTSTAIGKLYSIHPNLVGIWSGRQWKDFPACSPVHVRGLHLVKIRKRTSYIARSVN